MKQYLLNQYYLLKYRQAYKAFKSAKPYPCYLPEEAFEGFVKKFGKRAIHSEQDYSIDGMNALATERYNYITQKINFIPDSVLEIGPGSGFVLQKFKEAGVKKVVALDILDNLFPETKKSGVEIVLTSAENMMEIPDKSFELIVSWSALEHISNPEQVFKECLRILKPGGYLYLKFGPLYYSAWGYHHYTTLKCPYLHILFPEYLIHQYAKKILGAGYEGYLPWTNGTGIKSYQFLRAPLPQGYLLESMNTGYEYFSPSSKMIIKYPGVFKSKNVPFESFFIDWIQVGIYRKK